jgi:hypothetical protein
MSKTLAEYQLHVYNPKYLYFRHITSHDILFLHLANCINIVKYTRGSQDPV